MSDRIPPFWSRIIIAFIFIVLLGFLFSVDIRDHLVFLNSDTLLANNLGFWFLINLNVVVLMVFAFLVIRNIVKLVLDRKQKILGSQLRARLVVAFVGVSLVPTVLLFLVSRGIVSSVLKELFSPRITAFVESSIGIAQYQYENIEREMRTKLSIFSTLLQSQDETTKLIVSSRRVEHNISELKLYALQVEEGSTEIAPKLLVNFGEAFNLLPQLEKLKEASEGREIVQVETSPDQPGIIRGYKAIPNDPKHVLVLSQGVDPLLSSLLSKVLDAYDDYREVAIYREPLRSSYVLTLVVVTLIVIFAGIWVGFYLARTIAEPILLLAEGTAQISKGNLDYQVPEVGGDELSVLVRSFNSMAIDLKRTTEELIERRQYMETILASVGVGVMSFSAELKITLCNTAAKEMLGIKGEFMNRSIAELFPEDFQRRIRELSHEVMNNDNEILVQNISLTSAGVTRHMQVTATRLQTESAAGSLGFVVLFDDLTELVRAQRTAAWQEVAKRMAHEIKNPLTPIQLSAQRIERHTLKENICDDVIKESVDIIVQQVETLRRLVDEFSRFSRMPKIKTELLQVNGIVEETIAIYKTSHPQVSFQLELAPGLPHAYLDREQMRRVFVNLFDNARSSMEEDRTTPVITIETKIDPEFGFLSIRVTDRGGGILDEDKTKLFEPYFSKKKGGTGLGLAIVNSIISDHHGFIRVQDNQPKGATFIIEIPVAS
jgi:two-component system nitrogen regulation sensor histidine kinase NtrY